MQDKILIVDDEELVLECLRRMLGRYFTLETASTCTAALNAAATTGPFAVVLSDMRMPGMNGIQLLQEIKKTSPQTVGIVLSGNPEDLRDVVGGAVYKVVGKPCPFDELIQILKEAIAHYHAGRSSICVSSSES